MEMEQGALNAFVRLHARKCKSKTDERVAYLYKYSESIPLDAQLVKYKTDDILSVFKRDSHLVRWLVEQVNSYDVKTQCVIGLIFDNATVLAHVIQLTPFED